MQMIRGPRFQHVDGQLASRNRLLQREAKGFVPVTAYSALWKYPRPSQDTIR